MPRMNIERAEKLVTSLNADEAKEGTEGWTYSLDEVLNNEALVVVHDEDGHRVGWL